MRIRKDPWLVAILLVAVLLDVCQLGWGLPNGNDSWAADAIGPVTALGIVQRSFATWNSGWFWFKYPLGYPFLLTATFLPYLAYQRIFFGWHPVAQYPYGFADPEQALFVLALCGRTLNVAFGLGTVLVAYCLGKRLFGLATGRFGAFFVATAYPVVYYAHTTNLDAGYLFWLMLALLCAIDASDSAAPDGVSPPSSPGLLPWCGLGTAAAMVVATKEQGFAFLLPLPFLVVAARLRHGAMLRVLWSRPVMAMAGAAFATMLLANNVLVNPTGFVARLAYLLGHPLQPVSARLAPIEFALWKGGKEWIYLQQLWDAIGSALGTPMTLLAMAGALTAFSRPVSALWLFVPALSYYYISLRALELITLRYTLPLQVIGAILAAGFLEWLYHRGGRSGLRWAAVTVGMALSLFGLARALELHWLFRVDPRHQAEVWMEAHLPAGATVEVYQKPVYLPRFVGGLTVDRVPIGGRSLTGIEVRRPDAVVISSASAQSITHVWNEDWRTSRTLLSPQPDAVELLDALQGGRMNLHVAAMFEEPTRFLRLRITSLNPKITVYAR